MNSNILSSLASGRYQTLRRLRIDINGPLRPWANHKPLSLDHNVMCVCACVCYQLLVKKKTNDNPLQISVQYS